MTEPPRIMPGAPSEWERLRDLRLRALREDPAGFSSTYAEELELTEADWRRRAATPGQIVASRGGHDCGTVLMLATPDGFQLVAMWVAPLARGTGLAEALVRAALADAGARGAETVALRVFDDNLPAARLYRRLGFRDEGTSVSPGRAARLLRLRWTGDPTGAVPVSTPAGVLRHTAPADLAAVAALEAAPDTALWLAVTGTPWHEAALADPDQRHLVLTDADHVVGFATLAGARRTDHRVELRRMVLHPGLRSRGNGRVLLEAVGRYAGTALGARTLWLDVKAENVRARGLYAAAGFTPYEDPPVRPDPGLVYLARPAN